MESDRLSTVLLPVAAVLCGVALLAWGGTPQADLVVLFDRPPGPDEVAMIEDLGGQVVRESVSMPVLQIRLPETARDRLAAMASVIAVSHERERSAS